MHVTLTTNTLGQDA